MGEAPAGREVAVGDLHGIVEIERAALTIVEIPAAAHGGSAAVDAGWLRTFGEGEGAGIWAALDETGEGALAGLEHPWHFEFAPSSSAPAAVARGASPVFFGGPEAVALLVAALEAGKAEGRLSGFTYKVVRAPKRRAR